jgi:hypothetical protein
LGALNGVATLGGDGKLSSNQVAALTTASQLALIGTSALPAIGAQAFLSATSTGTGSVVLSSGPALVSAQLAAPLLTSPALGTPVSGNLSNCTNVNLNSVTGTLAIANGGTGATTATGTGSVVLATSPTLASATLSSPTLTTPVLGTPASGNLSNCTNIPLSAATGTLATTVGGTGQTTYANGELLIGNSSGGLSKATLTAGSNVSITNASGSVTVESSIPAATTAQLGGIIPGPGFTISSGQLNAILPRAIASFNGQFATTTQVTASYSKTGSTVTITYDFSGGKPQFYANNKAYFVFTKASGAGTVPANTVYTILTVSTSESVQTITVSSAVAGDSAGSVVFRYCSIISSQNIASIIFGGAVANTSGYIVNLNFQLPSAAFTPVVTIGSLIDAITPTIVATQTVAWMDCLNSGSLAVPRSTSSFCFIPSRPGSSYYDAGYGSGVIIYA